MDRLYVVVPPEGNEVDAHEFARFTAVYTTAKALLRDIQKYVGYYLYVIPPNVEIEHFTKYYGFYVIRSEDLLDGLDSWSFDELDILGMCQSVDDIIDDVVPGNQ